MWVPSKRLLWIVAATILPAWLLPVLTGAPVEIVYLAGAAAILLTAVDAAISIQRLQGIRVHAPELLRSAKNKPFHLLVTARWPAGGIRRLRVGVSFPKSLEVGSHELTLQPAPDATSGEVLWEITPRARGSFVLDRCFLETPSAMGLWDVRTAVTIHCEVRVYPELSRDRHLLAPLFSRKAIHGIHQVRQLGKGREFQQLRGYVPGDSFSDIYWKGTAKRRFPVTTLYQVERTQEVHVLVDISRLTARPLEAAEGLPPDRRASQDTLCERFLQTALVLAAAAEQQGDRFGMLTFSDSVHTAVSAGSGRSHYNACRETLYQVQPRPVTPDFQELFIHIGNRLRTRSLLILLTDLGEPGISEAFVEAVQQAARKHVILVHVLGSREMQPLFSRHDSAENGDALYRKLARHMEWSDLQEITSTLKQGGIHLTASLQENLAAGAVSAYLNVKKRQLL